MHIPAEDTEWIDVSWSKLEGQEYQKQALLQAEKECIEKINKEDFLERANKNAVITVENFFEGMSLGDEPYEVNVKIVANKKETKEEE